MLVGLGALLSLVATSALAAPAAQADSSVSSRSGSFTLDGRGFGHGWGMSQYGAYGAAKKGLTWKQILAFYYPGTTRTMQTPGTKVRVWITADTDSAVTAAAASGLKVTSSAGGSYSLPTGSAYASWRISRSGPGMKLQHRGTGAWTTRSTSLKNGTWTFSDSASLVRVILPKGSTRDLRGRVSLVQRGTGGRTVNTLTMEDYVRGVVPAEMPTSWATEAVRSQAVAARTYAAKLISNAPSGNGYDICDTTACQVYRGQDVETANGNAAVAATARTILTYGSSIALTQFSSSNGGQAAKGDYPYLTAHKDPYDGVVTPNTWSKTITAASLGRIWPSAGTVKQLQVVSRDGQGTWGGRIVSIRIVGSNKTVTVAGTTFRNVYGLRSNFFTVRGATTSAPAPAPTPAPAPKPSPAPTPTTKGAAYASFPRTYDASHRAELLLVNASGALVRYPVASPTTLGKPQTLAKGFGAYSHVVNAGDWNGDGYQDVIARTDSQRLLLFRGTANGGLSARVDMGLTSNHTSITSVGDVTGDKHPDLMVVNTSGRLYLVPGNGKTGFTPYTRIATGWKGQAWMRSPGDLTGDKRADLVTKVGDRLYLHRGLAKGFAAPTVISRGWSSMSAITSIGDFDGDKRADLVARNKSGRLVLFTGNGTGAFAAGVVLAGSYGGTRFAV